MDGSQVYISQDVSKRGYYPQIVNMQKYHLIYASLGRSQHVRFFMGVAVVFITMMISLFVKYIKLYALSKWDLCCASNIS